MRAMIGGSGPHGCRAMRTASACAATTVWYLHTRTRVEDATMIRSFVRKRLYRLPHVPRLPSPEPERTIASTVRRKGVAASEWGGKVPARRNADVREE